MNRFTILSVLLISILFAGRIYSQQTVGLFTEAPGSLSGYVLFTPFNTDTTYLIDKCGKKVHTWKSTHHPGLAVYFLPDGNLLRAGTLNNSTFTSGGSGGIIEKFDWSSNLLWSYIISSNTQCQHHDVRQLPNGNILAISWELKTSAEAMAAGRNPANLGNSLWSEKIVELQPISTNQANIVWEWHVWDHLVQQYDASKSNYGIVSDHPELINLNYVEQGPLAPDWLHINGIDYNEEFDQIIISCHNFSELWIIDHSTTAAEATLHSGGAYGKGGDLLYRWGNPQTYERGSESDQKLFGQHNPSWIPDSYPDGGKIIVFNNGDGRPGGNYSTVDIIDPPTGLPGFYTPPGLSAYLPDSAEWHYQAPNPTDFYSSNISGAQRLSNGNTLICEGQVGNFFEIDPNKNTVWDYVNPVGINGIASQGSNPIMNSVFRCTLYEPFYSGFAGQTLIPGNPIEINPLPNTCEMFTGIGKATDLPAQGFTILNPFSNQLVLFSNENSENASAMLVDETGRLIASWSQVDFIVGQEVTLTLKRNISPGVYLLRISDSKHNWVMKVIHQL